MSRDTTVDLGLLIRPAPFPLAIKSKPAHRKNYRFENPARVVRFIVIHCTDGHEGVKKDDDVAAMFASRDLSPRRSCHYVVDADSATQCVADESIAWHCATTGNLFGVGIEICGFARQSRAEWLDATSKATLAIAARLTYELCRIHRLPLTLLGPEELRKEASGITTHASVSAAWRETSHYDPGPHFPMDLFMKAVTLATRP